MYTNISTNENYPKTLIIRNHLGGMIWQVYHVQKESEANKLYKNATKRGFRAITLEDYKSDKAETWPNWKEVSPRILEKLEDLQEECALTSFENQSIE